MNFPEGYFIRTENGSNRRVLMEMAKVYRRVPHGSAEILEADVRSVASFPKAMAQSQIREIAKLDERSKNPAIAPVERQEALAERFG